ncbi:MAG: glycosyltransferase family 2 protein [Desulfobacterales bacterium]|nr:glycosyltransferase family 2 protein [Desulfobacterales bacterium]
MNQQYYKLSIVTTLYFSAHYIKEFYDRVTKSAKKITDDYEIIFVNDGSPDNSLEVALSILNEDNHVKIIDLSKNFGHYKAIMTGLTYAKGEYLFLIDCDLEEEPELLTQFWEEYHRLSNVDVVYGIQKVRKGRAFERISGGLFYTLINYLSGEAMPKNILTTRLMSKRYVLSLVSHKEKELFLAGLFYITGYNQHPIFVTKHSKGSTTYSFSKKMAVALNSITSFSDKPLQFIFNVGSIISLLSFCYIVYRIFSYVFFSKTLLGWASLIVSIWFLGGLNILFIGIIGIYLSKVFMEVKDRPYTIIKHIYEKL